MEAIGWRRGGVGFTNTPNALFRFSEQLGLKKLDLLVLLAILSHGKQDSTDFCTASYDQLSTDCAGLDRKTVVVHVQRLRKLGLLTSESRKKADKTQTTNTYNLQPLAEKLGQALATVGGQAVDSGGVDVGPSVGGRDGRNAAAPPRKGKGGFATFEKDADDDGDGERGRASASRATAQQPKRKTGWATVEKDPVDDELDDDRPDRSAGPPRTTSTPRPPSSPSNAREATPSSPWTPGKSRLRPPELDEPDRAALDRGERLQHPDGDELTVDEHLRRMREMECYTTHAMVMLLMDLRFPNDDITAAVNANPVEHIGRLVAAQREREAKRRGS